MSENYPNLVPPDPIRLMIVKDLDRIKFNVGGQKFETSADTLKKYESFFSRLLAADIVQKVDADNYILIDRDGTHFGKILNFMRNNTIYFGDNVAAAKEIRMEADFYQLQELIQKCDEFLASPMANLSACERAVHTTEERECMISTGKALVFLNIGTISGFLDNLTKEKEQECNKAISTAVIHFMKLRKQFHHFTFILDFISRKNISLDFYFDVQSVASVPFYDTIFHNALFSVDDTQILQAVNTLSTKMLDKLTGIQR